MTYNNPQHNTNKYSCTPFPILKEGDTSGGIVTYLDLVDLGSISGFGVNLTEIGGTQRWDNTIITNWQTLFNAINEHLTIFNARLQELEQSANPDAITIISKSNNQLEANVNNVTWSSSSPQIIVYPETGQTTTYSLASSATSYGSFTLTANRELIEEGDSITITAQWTGKTTTYDAIITATKSGMTPATKSVQLPKEAICPTSVTLDNGKTITLNSSGYGTLTYTPSVGSYTIRTQGNETQGSCSFTVAASQPTTTYYWYVGTTLPTAANLLSIATGSATSKPNWSTPYSIAATNNTGESSYLYYCFPVEWNVIVLDSDRSTEVALAPEGTITVNDITYNIQRTGRKISKGTSKDYYAIFNNVDAITITSKSNNQLEANVNNVNWSSDSSYIDVSPETGKTTTYSLTDSATSYGTFILTAYPELMEEGDSVTITAQWYDYTTTYDATITATKSGMTPATKSVQLSKNATCPASVTLDNGEIITLNTNSGRGTCTYTPVGIGNYTVTTQGNETQGSCSFTVVEATPVVEPVNADIVAIYNIQDISNPTTIFDNGSSFKAMEIDGVAQPIVVSSYKFDTTGQHTIKYELNDSVIGDWAFDGRTGLTSVDILDSVTSIGSNAFYRCSGLTSVTIGNGVTSIGSNAFADCGSLTSCTIGSGVTSIGTNAFQNCSSLTSVDLPNSVTSIGLGAFSNCSSLTSIDIPNSVTSISNMTFSNCSGLTSVTLPNRLTEIGYYAFSDCNFTSIDIPSSVTNISSGAFQNCTNLINIVSNAMTAPKIYNTTFQDVKTGGTLTVSYYSSDYDDVWLSKENYYLGKYNWNMEYYDEPKTITITSKSGNQLEANVDNVSWSSDSSYINVYPETGQTTTYSLSDSATSYGSFTLNVDNKLIEEGESITITAQWYEYTTPYSATITATKSGMTSATKFVQLSKAATCPSYVYLDNGARITLDSNGRGTYTYTPTVGNYTIRTQGNETQGSCSFTVNEVTPVVEPVNADIVAVYNIQDTSKSTKLSDNASSFKAMEIDGVVQPSVVTSYKFDRHGNHTIKYELNGSNIGDNAFDGCSDLRSIDILNSVTSIGDYAFDNCTGLASCTIGNGVTSIGNTAFNCCSDLSSITIGNSVTSIGDTAFAVCNELTSIDIPNSVTSIGEYAFQDCSNLTSITLSNRLTKISNSAFEGCSSLTSIDIPDGVTNIDDYAFNGCSGLTNVTIGSGVTRIGGDAFYGCSSLTSIDIPDSVTKIGERAFENCTSLINVTSHAMTAPDISNNTFRNVKTGGTLTVSYYSSSSDYNDVWLSTDNYYLGKYNWNMKYYDEPETITITSKSNNQLEANVDNVNWSSDSSYIDVNPTTGKTTTYSLNITPYGSFELTASESSIEEGESITITAQWTGHSRRYSATITASKPGMISTRKEVQLFIEETCPAYVDLDNGARITLDSNGRGTYTYTPTVGSYTIRTQGNETSGSCSFTVNESMPKTITITSKSNNQLEANVDNVYWSSDSSYINVYPETGQTTTYSLSSSATSYGSFVLNVDNKLIEEGESITITAQWYDNNTPYSATITATNPGMTSATKFVQLYKAATCPAYVDLDNGARITLNNSGRGTYTYTPAVGNYTIKTQGNEVQGSCSFTVNESMPKTITITSKSGNQLEANVDNVSWSSDSSYINVYPETGQTTTYSLSSSATSYGSFTLTTNKSSIQEGESIAITAQWHNNTTPYSATITATKSGMTPATKSVQLSKNATCPASVTLDNGQTITLNISSGSGTRTYTPTVGNYTVTTQGNETPGSCSFTVVAAVNVNADLIAQYNIQSTSSPTTIFNNGSSFKAMEIDGVVQPNVVASYKFNTTGTHTIKYELNDSSIGSSAFSGCSGLTSVTIGNGVTSIGSSAFAGCSGLTSVTIGNGVTSIGNNVFASCGLTSVDIPDSVTSIGTYAFYACSSLTSINIPDGVTSISNWAFSDCSGLTSIDIPDSVTIIGTNAFYNCSSLTSVTIGNSVTDIYNGAFSNCSGLTSIVSNAMTAPNISNNTFQNVKNNGRLTISYYSSGYDTWLSTGDYFLGKYDWVRKYDDAPNVEPINEDIVAYYNIQDTSSPTTICDNRGNKFKSMEIDGVVQSSVVSSYQFNTTGTHTIKYELNDSNIANGAFSTCTSLTSCTIADSVTSIGMGAFAGCSGLTSIDIPDSVTSIGTNAFSGCSSLTSIVCNAMTAPKITSSTFASIATDGTLTIPTDSSGYDVWLGEGNYYLGKYGWHPEPM